MGRLRNKQVIVRMTEDEFKTYEKLVKKSKLDRQEYGLKCLLNKEICIIEGIVDLAYQIRKIGVNINQLVHFVNSNKNINQITFEEIDKNIKEVWKLMNDFVKSAKKQGV